MTDFEVITEGNPLYAEIDRLKREQNELQSAFEDAVTRAEKAEGERDALADALSGMVNHADSAIPDLRGEAYAIARAALAQVRK